jgi:hypothetical protein
MGRLARLTWLKVAATIEVEHRTGRRPLFRSREDNVFYKLVY